MLGDVNGDGTIDAFDASLVLSEYAIVSTGGEGYLTEKQRKSADLNCDNSVDSLDASIILNYYAFISVGGTQEISEYIASIKL
ncbi:MAG: hypothetical protein E7506_07620 [Ruminococcus sp.]|nr:hypothetical protein [Ruminococcus sp.]